MYLLLNNAQEKAPVEGMEWAKFYEPFFIPKSGEILEQLLLSGDSYEKIAKWFQEALIIRLKKNGMLARESSDNLSIYKQVKKIIYEVLDENGPQYAAAVINEVNARINTGKDYAYIYAVLMNETRNKNPKWVKNEKGEFKAK